MIFKLPGWVPDQALKQLRDETAAHAIFA